MYALQRRLVDRDGGRWALIASDLSDEQVVEAALHAERIARIRPMELRIVPDRVSAQALVQWTPSAGFWHEPRAPWQP